MRAACRLRGRLRYNRYLDKFEQFVVQQFVVKQFIVEQQQFLIKQHLFQRLQFANRPGGGPDLPGE